jgi:ubiquinone/menaquinone biosynthesis C-methylase UbiE
VEQELVLDLVGDVRECQVLDIGCGDGILAVELHKRGADVVGLDASQPMLDAAERRTQAEHADLTLCLGRAEALPFDDASFDVVVAVTILCFVPHAAQSFAEIGRVLRPGGRLVIGELGKWSTWAARRRIKAWLGSRMWQAGHFRTVRELKHLAQFGGLIPQVVQGAIYYPHSDFAARHLQRFEPWLNAHTTFGAAFLTLSAVKPS